MKFLIASDIHGSIKDTDKLMEIFDAEGADELILLGDIYNHGPRNGLPDGYDPLKVADRLNGIKDRLIVIKGNCDSEVDEMISEFDFVESATLIIGGKRIFLTHGHRYNIDNLPKNSDAVIYGHFHTGFIKEKDGIAVANPGSVTFPKDNTPKSYIILEEKKMVLKDIDGKVLAEKSL